MDFPSFRKKGKDKGPILARMPMAQMLDASPSTGCRQDHVILAQRVRDSRPRDEVYARGIKCMECDAIIAPSIKEAEEKRFR